MPPNQVGLEILVILTCANKLFYVTSHVIDIYLIYFFNIYVILTYIKVDPELEQLV